MACALLITMEEQRTIHNFDKELKTLELEPIYSKSKHLEFDKERFIESMCEILDIAHIDEPQIFGRPRFDIKDILKSLLIMSYHSWSYRKCQSDLKILQSQNKLNKCPTKSTLNRYANSEKIKNLLLELIPFSAFYFQPSEDCLLIDSTWLSKYMYTGGAQRVANKKNVRFDTTRKIQIACFKNSKAIAYAIPTEGQRNDSPYFQKIVQKVLDHGFYVQEVLADAGYLSKDNYRFCQEKNINKAFINFKSNCMERRAKSGLYRQQLRVYRENYVHWKEHYRFRVIVEGVISSLKRRSISYLRSRNIISMDVELLLKCLAYNFSLIGRYKRDDKIMEGK